MSKIIPFTINSDLIKWLYDKVNEYELDAGDSPDTPFELKAAAKVEAFQEVIRHIEPNYHDLLKGNIET